MDTASSAASAETTPKSKITCFENALQHLHHTSSAEETIVSIERTSIVSPFLVHKWAGDPGNSTGHIPHACAVKLIELYQLGKECKH
eukprot:4933020-Ditylum_brightwellii.AAC.1